MHNVWREIVQIELWRPWAGRRIVYFVKQDVDICPPCKFSKKRFK